MVLSWDFESSCMAEVVGDRCRVLNGIEKWELKESELMCLMNYDENKKES